MEKEIMGVSQQFAIDHNLTISDIVVASWAYRSMGSYSLDMMLIDGKVYERLEYDNFLYHYPLITTSKAYVGRLLKKLVSVGVLDVYVTNTSRGRQSYYGYGSLWATAFGFGEVQGEK